MFPLTLAFAFLPLAADPVDPAKLFEQRTYRLTVADHPPVDFKYRLLMPEKIEPGTAYPVVLFLHGAGERGSDNEAQLKYFPWAMVQPEYRAKYPAFVIAKQCSADKKWVDVNWSKHESEPMPENPSDEMLAAVGMLDAVIKSQLVDVKRVYLTGLSMGGYGAWDLAERMPDRFAAVAPICGGGDESHADRLVKVPIYAYHGDQDNAVPVARSRGMIEAITKAGGHPKYKELPGVGHNSWVKAYNDPDGVVPWMFEQAKK